VEPIEQGLINQTYRLRLACGRGVILQSINTQVFPDIAGLMKNLQQTCQILKASAGSSLPYEAFALFQTLDGKHYLTLEDGKKTSYWRALELIEDVIAYDEAPNAESLRLAAKGFGCFVRCLSHANPSDWVEVIPNFHHVPMRLEQLSLAVSQAKDEARLLKAQPLLEKLQQVTVDAGGFQQSVENTPLRLVHNDTKLNNLLFDKETGAVKAVVDLDTTMPGYLAYDFGDMVRSAASGSSWPLRDVQEIMLPVYVEALSSMANTDERTLFEKAPQWVAIELSARFLADYLAGDVYFHTTYAEENLDRARQQWQLQE